MLSFLPRSQIALIATGFLATFLIQLDFLHNLHFLFYSILILISILVYYLKKRTIYIRNFILLMIGFSLGILVQQNNKSKEENNRKEILQIYQELKFSSKKIHITPIKVLAGEFYLAKINFDQKERYLPFRVSGDKRWEVFCNSQTLKLVEISLRNQHFRTLKTLGGYYLRWNPKDCEYLREHIFPSQLVKNQLSQILEKGGIHGIYKGIAMGLLFGESKFLDSELHEDAKESGTLHLFAASGLHMGILLGFLYFFTKHILRLDYYSSIIAPLLVGFLYLYILNFPVSLSRAFIFACMIVISKCLFRELRPTDILLVSAGGIALFKPENLFSIGFNLSFSAVAGIFYLKPKLDLFIFHGKKSFLSDNLTVSLSATLGTFFVSWYYFPGFSFGGILANLILVPLTGFLLPILYANILIDLTTFHWTAEFFWSWTDFLLRILVLATEFLSNTVGYYQDWGIGRFSTIYFFLTILSLILLFPYTKKFKWIYTFICLILLPLLFIFGYRSNLPDAPNLKKNFELLSISQDSYLFLIQKNLYLGGYCKKDLINLKKKISRGFCRNIQSLYIESDTCLPIARYCYLQNKNLFLKFANKHLKDWSPAFGQGQIEIIKKNSLYSIGGKPVLIYKAGWDPIWLPNYLSKKNKNGILILQRSLSYNKQKDIKQKSRQVSKYESRNEIGNSKDNSISNGINPSPSLQQIQNEELSQEKEKWKKSLGIPSDWIILDQSELAHFPLL